MRLLCAALKPSRICFPRRSAVRRFAWARVLSSPKWRPVQRWPQAVLDALEKAWIEVADQEGAADANFKRVWSALSAFRAEYETWRRLGHLP